MEEPHAEGLASHGDRESCACTRKDASEALTAACTGWVLSPEKKIATDRRRCPHKRKATFEASICEMTQRSAWSETPYMCRNSMRGNRESPSSTLANRTRVRIGKPKGTSR
jgi:RNA-directed DNA polymerase